MLRPSKQTLLKLSAAKDYELKRDNVKLYEVLGEGQFGDVYKGAWTDKVCHIT
jgi:hypothetical protein